MSTSLKIDDALVAKAMKVGKHGSKIETVSCALEEYVSRHQPKKAIKLFGTSDNDHSYDYKA